MKCSPTTQIKAAKSGHWQNTREDEKRSGFLLVVDDVYGGGGTTKGLMELADKAGAIVAAHAVIAVEAGVELPKGIFYLFTLPLGE